MEFYYRDEGFYLEVPKYYSLTGDIYLLEDLLQGSYPTDERDKIEDVDFKEKLTFLMSHNGSWVGPCTNGKDLVILEEGHDSCKITARGKGKVTVKCTYSYTKKNSLTGREEDDPEIDTKRFDIIIE